MPESNRSKYIRKKEFVTMIKATSGCVDCGIKNPVVLDFDHVPERGPKLFELHKFSNHSFPDIAAEIQKCDVVCANCHRIRSWARGQRYSRRPPHISQQGLFSILNGASATPLPHHSGNAKPETRARLGDSRRPGPESGLLTPESGMSTLDMRSRKRVSGVDSGTPTLVLGFTSPSTRCAVHLDAGRH